MNEALIAEIQADMGTSEGTRGGNSITDSTQTPTNKAGYQGNLNAAKTLEYAKNIEERVDGRSLLGLGLASHRNGLLTMFNVTSLDVLNSIEQEAVRRLVKRRVVREIRWGRLQRTFETQDIAAFDIEVPLFQNAVDAEERTESRVEVLIQKHHREKKSNIISGLAAAAAEANQTQTERTETE